MKTLYLEKRGLDFWKDEPLPSDVGNFRVCTGNYNVKGKSGRTYFVEFSYDRRKKGMHISLAYENDQGAWGDLKLESEIYNMNLSYTFKDILYAINHISEEHYDEVKFK